MIKTEKERDKLLKQRGREREREKKIIQTERERNY